MTKDLRSPGTLCSGAALAVLLLGSVLSRGARAAPGQQPFADHAGGRRPAPRGTPERAVQDLEAAMNDPDPGALDRWVDRWTAERFRLEPAMAGAGEGAAAPAHRSQRKALRAELREVREAARGSRPRSIPQGRVVVRPAARIDDLASYFDQSERGRELVREVVDVFFTRREVDANGNPYPRLQVGPDGRRLPRTPDIASFWHPFQLEWRRVRGRWKLFRAAVLPARGIL